MSIHKNSLNNIVFLDQKSDQKRKRNTIKFTAQSIKYLKPRNVRTIFWCEGMTEFGIRVSPKGSKVWIYEYRFGNKGKRLSLGRYPQLSLAKATKLFSEARIKVLDGIDPLAHRNKIKKQEQEAETVNQLANQYIEYCILNPS